MHQRNEKRDVLYYLTLASVLGIAVSGTVLAIDYLAASRRAQRRLEQPLLVEAEEVPELGCGENPKTNKPTFRQRLEAIGFQEINDEKSPRWYEDRVHLCVMNDPVRLHPSNKVVDRETAVDILATTKRCPFTQKRVTGFASDETVREAIEDFVAREEDEYLRKLKTKKELGLKQQTHPLEDLEIRNAALLKKIEQLTERMSQSASKSLHRDGIHGQKSTISPSAPDQALKRRM